jgi:mono/diheme cytochrome c family protein
MSDRRRGAAVDRRRVDRDGDLRRSALSTYDRSRAALACGVHAMAAFEISLMNRWAIAVAIAASLACARAAAQPAGAAESRGELLYSTHCVSCHTAQVHWRDKKLATDWPSLGAQVRRWQSNLGLRWSDADIVEVSRYLNRRHYRFKEAGTEVSRSSVDRSDRACMPGAASLRRKGPGLEGDGTPAAEVPNA